MIKQMVTFVTGGGGSLGSATAKHLAKIGHKVTLFDLPKSNGELVAKEIGENALFCPGDICSEENLLESMENTVSNFGSINVVVNCAGTYMAKTMFNFNKESRIEFSMIEKFIQVNLLGTLNVIRCSLDYLGKNTPDQDGLRGLLVNTSGFAGHDGQKGHVIMGAVWGGINSMTLPMCRELADVGVRVMTIAPGLMNSSVMDTMPVKVIKLLSVLTPAPKRLGYPEEYAQLVETIIKNPFLNGETIKLDGGLRFHMM